MRRLLLLLSIIPTVILATETPSVHEYKLNNGLKVIIREDHRSAVVFSSIWYKVGGSYEPRGITGISHALEHMMFRGTAHYGPDQFSQIINANGGAQNAMTSEDFTVFFQTLPADKLDISFKLEADRMSNLSLDKDAFAKEIQVVMEERRMRTEDNPQALTTERYNAIAYINNPYNHPVVGWMSDLQQMTASDLRAWYQSWYAPNNAILVVVGDVNSDKVFDLAKKYFGGTSLKKLPQIKHVEEVSALGIRRIDVKIPAQLPWVILGYSTPALTSDPQSLEPYALTVLAYVLGGGSSSRLNRDLVRQQQIAVSTSADYDLYTLYHNLFTITATPSKGVTNENLQNALQKEILSLQTDLVSQEELARAKALLIASHTFEQDSLMAQAINLGLPEVIGLSWRQEDEFINRIESITPQQVRSAAKQYLTNDRVVIGTLEPIIQPAGTPQPGETYESNSVIH